MSSLIDGLMGQLGGDALGNLAGQLGTDKTKAQAGMAAALPLLLGALSRNAESNQGAASLGAALERDHDGSILDNAAGFFGSGDTSMGAGILKHVLGAKQDRAAQGVSKASGLDPATAGKMLTLLAPMVLGALGKAKRQEGLDTAGLANMLGGERQAMEKKAPQLGMLGALLDQDGDGDMDANDIAKLGGGMLGKLFGGK
ncbi:DUF937 domain-containing protein [bacterium]|nr:DUF937 domain-containing protein [bacterium]